MKKFLTVTTFPVALAAGVVSLGLTAPLALADVSDRADRLDNKGDRIERRLEYKGDQINDRLDRRSDRAEANGNGRLAERLDRKGDKIENRLERKGDRINSRLDRRAAIERRN